jgi:hypothetical protein
MLKKFEPPSRLISRKGMIDYLRIPRKLSNVPRREPDTKQLVMNEARVSLTRDNRSQMRSILYERIITFTYNMGNLAIMYQPI